MGEEISYGLWSFDNSSNLIENIIVGMFVRLFEETTKKIEELAFIGLSSGKFFNTL
jgi:hypothetical protein